MIRLSYGEDTVRHLKAAVVDHATFSRLNQLKGNSINLSSIPSSSDTEAFPFT